MSTDRLKTAARALQNLDPMIRYRMLYRGKVIGQRDGTVDVRPYDASLPDMAGIPLRHGIPGLVVQVALGCSIQIGFDDGRPDRPFAALWSTDASAVRISIPATLLELGGENPPNAAVLGTAHFATLSTAMTTLASAMTALAGIGVLSAIVPALGSAASACTAQATALPSQLSTTVRVK